MRVPDRLPSDVAAGRQRSYSWSDPGPARLHQLDLTVRFLRPVTAATGTPHCEGTVLLYAQATSSCMIFRP